MTQALKHAIEELEAIKDCSSDEIAVKVATEALVKIAALSAQAAQAAEPSRKPTLDNVQIIYKSHGTPDGIRDHGGFLFFFTEIHRYDGQEARYKEEIDRQHNIANYVHECLVDWRLNEKPLATRELTDTEIMKIRDSVHCSEGIDGDQFDLAFARAIMGAKK